MPLDLEVLDPEIESEIEQVVKPNSAIVQSVLDIAQVKPSFEAAKLEAERIGQEIQSIEVKDDQSLALIVAKGGAAKGIAKAIDTRMKAIILEPETYIKQVKSLCKTITEKLKAAEEIAKTKVTQYNARRELARREAEDLARKESEKLQQKINEEAEAAGVEAPQVLPPVIPEQKNIVRTESGTTAYSKGRWTYDKENVDLSQVPREYLMVNDQAVRNAIKMGIREIAGLRIFEETKTVFRG